MSADWCTIFREPDHLNVHLENGERFVLTVLTEQSYASEVKVGERIICWLGRRGFILNVLREKLLLEDKAYDSVKFFELLKNVSLEPYIKVKETFRRGIKSEVRLRTKRFIDLLNCLKHPLS